MGGSRCVSDPPMTSGSKSVLCGISSISSRAVVVFPAPNAPLIQTTVTDSPSSVGPLRLARSTLPRKPRPGEGTVKRVPGPRDRTPARALEGVRRPRYSWSAAGASAGAKLSWLTRSPAECRVPETLRSSSGPRSAAWDGVTAATTKPVAREARARMLRFFIRRSTARTARGSRGYRRNTEIPWPRRRVRRYRPGSRPARPSPGGPPEERDHDPRPPRHHPLAPHRPQGTGAGARAGVAGVAAPAAGTADLLPGAQRGLRDPDRPGLERAARRRGIRDALRGRRRVPPPLPGTPGRRRDHPRTVGSRRRVGGVQPAYRGADRGRARVPVNHRGGRGRTLVAHRPAAGPVRLLGPGRPPRHPPRATSDGPRTDRPALPLAAPPACPSGAGSTTATVNRPKPTSPGDGRADRSRRTACCRAARPAPAGPPPPAPVNT
ncbi:hypothetical protein SGPA1_20902 [Streptomyces misionensis JCM 4497]